MSEQKTLLLTETGVAKLPDGSTAINVGPIVRALEFLTEGRGEDRGTDEDGHPLPDLMSLAFDVVQSIILGGRKADFFRKVKQELETHVDASARSSLALAKQAKRVQPRALSTPLDHAADSLRNLLGELRELSLSETQARELQQALEAFRAFGADRWVSATAQLLLAISAAGEKPSRKPPRKKRSKVEAKPSAVSAAPATRKPARSKRKAARKSPKKQAPSKRKPSRR